MIRMNRLVLVIVASFLLIIPLAVVPVMAQYSRDYNTDYYRPGGMSNIGTGTTIGGVPGSLLGTGIGTPLGGVGIGSGIGVLTPGGQIGVNTPTGSYIGGGLGLPSSGIGGVPVGGGLGTTTGGILGF